MCEQVAQNCLQPLSALRCISGTGSSGFGAGTYENRESKPKTDALRTGQAEI